MWLYLPSQCLDSPPEAACSKEPSSWLAMPSESDPFLWVTLSGKPTRRRLSWRRWAKRPWVELLSGTMLEPSTADAGADAWTSSLRATRANHSVSPANVLGKAIRDTFGPKSVESLRKCSRNSCSWRTYLHTSLWDSIPLPQNWRDLATQLRRDSSRRAKRARAIDGSGCSSSDWQTPSSAGHSSRKQIGATEREALLSKEAETWMSPNAGDAKGRQYQRTNGQTGQEYDVLPGQAMKWPTARARDHRGGKVSQETLDRNARPLNEIAVDFPSTLPDETTGRPGKPLRGWRRPSCPVLNARFVEWLMAWPLGLTAFDVSETEWTRWRRLMRSSLCSLVRRVADNA